MTFTMTKTVDVDIDELATIIEDTVSDFINERFVSINDDFPYEIYQNVLKTVCEKIINEER